MSEKYSWWGDYFTSIETKSATRISPQLNLLRQYFCVKSSFSDEGSGTANRASSVGWGATTVTAYAGGVVILASIGGLAFVLIRRRRSRATQVSSAFLEPLRPVELKRLDIET